MFLERSVSTWPRLNGYIPSDNVSSVNLSLFTIFWNNDKLLPPLQQCKSLSQDHAMDSNLCPRQYVLHAFENTYSSVLIWQTTEIGVSFPVIAVLAELEKCSWFPSIKFSFWNNHGCSKHWPRKEGSFHGFPVMPILRVLFLSYKIWNFNY